MTTGACLKRARVEWVNILVQAVLLTIRMPRIVLGVLVGAGLAVAGAALQGLFRHPLADPGLIGVSSSAVLAHRDGCAQVVTLRLAGIAINALLLGDREAGHLSFAVERATGYFRQQLIRLVSRFQALRQIKIDSSQRSSPPHAASAYPLLRRKSWT
jgi:hypothetical protein